MTHRSGMPTVTACLMMAMTLSIATPFTGNAARADLLAYDPFAYGMNPAAGEYALGNEESGVDVIGSQNPTIGPTAFYTGAWIQSGGDSQVVKALPSLSYPGLAAGQGGIQQETVQFDCCSFGRSGREIAGGLGNGPDRTIYQSFLIDFGSQGDDAPTDFGFRGHELWNGGIGDSFKAVDVFMNHFSGINELTLSVTTVSGTTMVPISGGGLDLDALTGTNLIVMKYDFNRFLPDAVSVFMNPVVGAAEPGVPSAHVSVASSDLFITHQGAYTQFTFSGGTHVPGAIDEIRWGDTFADVTPIPEPSTALLLIAGIGLVSRRKARHTASR